MRVAIITINGSNNYGNRLQNYALQELLKKLDVTPVTVWHEKRMFSHNEMVAIGYRNIIKYFLNYKGFRTKILNKQDALENTLLSDYRQANIKLFTDKYISTRYDFCIKDNLDDEFNYFIDGSDQTWNPNFWEDKKLYAYVHFLQFAKFEKRISYAASFGISSLPKEYEVVFKNGFDGMANISVREDAGAAIVKKLTGRDVPVLIDPTLTLSKEEWRKVELKPICNNGEKFILAYFLGNVPEMFQKLAEKYTLKVYNLMDKNDFNLYTSRVEEFLWLIDNAELVCTDSFHACVFSILFNTPFLVVKRQQAGMEEMNSRLDTLLEKFGFEDRFFNFTDTKLDFDKVMKIDFSNVEEVQHVEIEKAVAFLKKSMGLE